MRAVLSRGLWMLVGMWFAARVEALPAALERVQCFGLEHGLLLDAAFDVKVDPNGYPWAGGYRVMGRFDGEQFDAPDALGVAFAAIKGTHAPVFAADGSAWFSTSTSVVRWHNDALTTLSPPVPLAEVAVLAADADALWLAGTEGLYRRPNDAVASDWGKRAHAGYPLGSDRRLHVDAQQVLWLRDQGLIELRRDPRQQDAMLSARVWDSRQGLPAAQLASLAEEAPGIWWIGSHDGLWRLDAQTQRASQVSGSARWNVRDVHRDRLGRWWVATAGAGLQRLEPDGSWRQFGTPEGLLASTVYRISESPHGELWLATEGAGICRVAAPVLQVFGQDQGLPNEFVHALAPAADAGVWVGGLGGLSRLSADGPIVPLSAISTQVGRVIALQPQGDALWIASDQGLHRYQFEALEPVPMALESNISSLALDTQARLWLAGDFGLAWLDDARRLHRVETPFEAMQDRRIRSVVAAMQGGVWVGMDNGALLRIDLQDQTAIVRWQRQVTPEDVRHVHEDRDGTLWVLSRGLYRVRGDQIDHFGQAEGLTDENLSDWAEDRFGQIWISSYVGLFRISRQALGSAVPGDWLSTVRRFDRRDGLRSAKSVNPGQPSLLVLADELWLATSAGVARMNLDSAGHEPVPMRIHWDRLRAGGREWSLQDNLHLPAGIRDVNLTYSLPPVAAYRGLRFRTRVLPIQPDWSAPTRSRDFSLPRLPAQHYRIEVQVLDGSLSPPTAHLELNIAARWWETWWGLALLLSGLFGSLLWLALRVISWRVNRLQRRADELKREVATRTLALAKANQDLARLARTDALTSVLNRRGFEESLAQHWQRLERGDGTACCLVLIDIDHFKRYNDHYGHPAGDGALAAVARVLSRQLDETQLLARIGGEEFAVILPLEGDGLREWVIRLRAAMQRLNLPHHGIAEDAQVTLSIGVSMLRSPPDEDAIGWLERADQQLYRAKQNGRDCACFDAACALGDAPQR